MYKFSISCVAALVCLISIKGKCLRPAQAQGAKPVQNNQTFKFTPNDYVYYAAVDATAKKQFAQARSGLAKLRRAEPAAVRNDILESDIYIKENNFKEAFNTITKALGTRQNSALLLAQRGYIYGNMDNETLAVADFVKAGKAPDLDAQAGTIILKGLLDFDRWEEALSIAQKCMTLKVVSSNLCSAASEVARHLNKLDLAEKFLERGMKECPVTFAMVQELCAIHKQTKNWNGIINDCARLPSMDAQTTKRLSYARCMEHRAEAYVNLKQYDKAVADYSTAINISPLNALNFKGRAAAYDKLGKTALAAADKAKAKQIDNSF